MLRELNRKFQDYMRPKRIAFGRYLWDKKDKKTSKIQDNIIENGDINSILFLRYDGKIGDMIINTLLFREIKKRYPHIKIGVVSRGGAIDIIKNNKNVDKIYNYSKKRSDIKKLARNISSEGYDLLIDFSENLKVNQMMFINLCKAKFNMGIEKENWELFDMSMKEVNYNFHISKLYTDILKRLGIYDADLSYDIYLTKENEEILKNIQGNYIVFNPYAASKHRSFNKDKTFQISKTILENRKENLILIGTNDHRKDLEEIKEKLGKRVSVPILKNILEVASLIKNANLIVTPDTSIVHIAVAYNRDMISIYRKENPDKNSILWGPNSSKVKVIFVEEKVKKGQEIDINKVNLKKIEGLLKVKYEKFTN